MTIIVNPIFVCWLGGLLSSLAWLYIHYTEPSEFDEWFFDDLWRRR
jgi:hypothetical protein